MSEAEMINVHLICDRNLFPLFNYVEIFKKYGLNILSDLKNCEYVFYLFNIGDDYYTDEYKMLWGPDRAWSFKRDAENLLYFINLNKKVILYYREDSFSNIDNLIDLIKDKNIEDKVILFRDFNLRLEFFNESDSIQTIRDVGNYKYFPNFILNNFSDWLSYSKLTKDHSLRTIKRTNYKFYRRMNVFTFKPSHSFIDNSYDLNTNIDDKPIDIFYVKHHRDTFDGFIRHKIKGKLSNIYGFKKFLENCDMSTYDKMLAKSKICVSTWGLGEYTYDDFKAIMNHTVLLKIDTSHIRDYYGIFNPDNGFIIYFKHDLSDLEEKITHILSNYPYYKNRATDAKKKLLKFDRERHVKDFCRMIRVNQYPL